MDFFITAIKVFLGLFALQLYIVCLTSSICDVYFKAKVKYEINLLTTYNDKKENEDA